MVGSELKKFGSELKKFGSELKKFGSELNWETAQKKASLR